MRPAALLLHCLVLATVVPAASRAQAPGASAGPDLNILALDWARGQYGSPFVCQVDGAPVRAVRHVSIVPAPSDRGAMARILFPDPEAVGATRCFSELGTDEPLVDGNILISLPGRSRTDTARHDFVDALRREDGFRYDIRSGTLSVKGWGPGNEEPRSIDFEGGHVSIHEAKPGTDAERLLRSFDSPRRLTLEIESPDGQTVLHFPLFQVKR
jgi:hypothetical protein